MSKLLTSINDSNMVKPKKSNKKKKSNKSNNSNLPDSIDTLNHQQVPLTPNPHTPPVISNNTKPVEATNDGCTLAARAKNFVETMEACIGDKVEIANRVLDNTHLINGSISLLKECLERETQVEIWMLESTMRLALKAFCAVQDRELEVELGAAKSKIVDGEEGRVDHQEEGDVHEEEEEADVEGGNAGGVAETKVHLRSAGLRGLDIDDNTFDTMRKHCGTSGPGTMLIYMPGSEPGDGGGGEADQDDKDWTGEVLEVVE
ncbi:hypothetical protein LTR78_009671 [Recurvomyces mirabilis]|uniref:Uncharacterized protein n=1 Tax=Recurvomyces mirabilis TaxID=574656 RepID=A0AAE0WFB1_9PEZI|nr:hypothetical protein LTR78_009671 [Recurvomyces mirabilis]KAK5150287.1 hypothetical protein LTS14_010264 [Recurvomyces mirabilis]